ncbi:LacI family DNA-binding transcriptional regulator [Schaalia hyovaginalis]|uniref:LacI family transcriptional regulator n=1 Tax=Schaalia hyovaginalis TaxID=29316 RepID=A0A923E1Q9_9ACTO|nr:LacI family DNA-binding transcriptional regulator [Schaalia hyovaginalis]MBB6334346.1 LacI family transcriptional regulator [Schaalia hyovaginalis]
MAKKPTLNDVAAKSGLSIFTVSRALNGAEGVSDESRRRVLEAARSIGYVPNTAARALRTQMPGPVMVMTASTSNSYYIDMIDGIQSGLREANTAMRFTDVAPSGRFDRDLEDAAIQEAMQSRAKGVISTLTLSPDNYEKLTEWGIPAVFVDSQAPDSHFGAASVTTDNADASAQIGRHLAFHGLDEWVLMIYPRLWSSRAAREGGFRAAAHEHGARLTVLECDNDARSAREVLDAHLAQRGTGGRFALVAGNNPLLQGALTALRERELRIPDEVAVIGFDEFAWAPLLDPPMTVIDEDSRSIGELAARKLLAIIARTSSDKEAASVVPSYTAEDREEVTATLLVRHSCGC